MNSIVVCLVSFVPVSTWCGMLLRLLLSAFPQKSVGTSKPSLRVTRSPPVYIYKPVEVTLPPHPHVHNPFRRVAYLPDDAGHDRARPEVRTLARALAIEDASQRQEFLRHTFNKLEELDEFVKFVEEGIEYLGDDFGFAVRTNMPQEHFDKMKAIYAEAAALRRKSLQ